MVEKRPDLRIRLRVELVSWRTLRRRVDVVDTTDAGDPVVSVGDELLVLPGRARHFRRFVTCEICGAEFLGSTPVLSLEQLERPSQPVVCATCAGPGRFGPQTGT